MVDSQKTWKWMITLWMMTLSENMRKVTWLSEIPNCWCLKCSDHKYYNVNLHKEKLSQVKTHWLAKTTCFVEIGGLRTTEPNVSLNKNVMSRAAHSSVIQQSRQTGGRTDMPKLYNFQRKGNCLTQLCAHCGAKTALSPASSIIHGNSALIYSTSTSQEGFYEPKMMS